MFTKITFEYRYAARSPRNFLLARAAALVSDVLFVISVFAGWAAISYGVTLLRYIFGAPF